MKLTEKHKMRKTKPIRKQWSKRKNPSGEHVLQFPPPIATMPLGIGNNLPFSFGWTIYILTLRGSSAGKGLGQSPSGRRFEPQQGHWRHYKPAASPGPRGTNRGGPALKQRDPVGTASRVRKATPGNH
ncbi:hypothetical protein MTR67_026896, partial [Solanum verrucosum]